MNPKNKPWTLYHEILIPIKLSHWNITKLKAFYEYQINKVINKKAL